MIQPLQSCEARTKYKQEQQTNQKRIDLLSKQLQKTREQSEKEIQFLRQELDVQKRTDEYYNDISNEVIFVHSFVLL